MDDRGIVVRFQVGARYFYVSLSDQTGPGDHTTTYVWDAKTCFLWEQCVRGVKVTVRGVKVTVRFHIVRCLRTALLGRSTDVKLIALQIPG
jgi:hypothetical protein